MNDTFTGWKPVSNKKFMSGRRGKHNATCPYCGAKKKNIWLHYRTYHPETLPELVGDFGEISGVRFIETSRELERLDQAGSGPSSSLEPKATG